MLKFMRCANRKKYEVASSTTRTTEQANNVRPLACKFCGKKHEFRKSLCPDWGKTCTLCGRKNHFASRCHTPQVQMIDHDDETNGPGPSEEAIKPTVYQLESGAASDRRSRKLFAHLLLGNNHLERFQLDTGASANIIPMHVYKKAYSRPCMKKLRPCDISLSMFNKSTTNVAGKTVMEVLNPQNCSSYLVEFLVVKEDFTPLIGSKTLQEMNFVEVKMENIACLSTKNDCTASAENGKSQESRTGDDRVLERFEDVFQGVGKLPGTLHVQIDEKVAPVQMTTRSVPEALREEVRAEIDQLVKDGTLKPVSEPTDGYRLWSPSGSHQVEYGYALTQLHSTALSSAIME